MIYTAYEIDRLSLVWDSIKNAENIIFEGELRLEKIQERMNKLHNDLNEQTQLLLDYDKTSDIKERQAMEDKIDYLTKKMHTTCLGTREVLGK
jgi:ABC-type phosphate transport system auxiliary subunit